MSAVWQQDESGLRIMHSKKVIASYLMDQAGINLYCSYSKQIPGKSPNHQYLCQCLSVPPDSSALPVSVDPIPVIPTENVSDNSRAVQRNNVHQAMDAHTVLK